MTQIHVDIHRLDPDLPLPRYESNSAAGMDLRASLKASVDLAPGARAIIPCGFRMALPAGFEAQIRPRSGLAAKHGISMVNAPGTIDADYRGEIMVILINLGQETFTVQRGERIAQMVIAPAPQANIREVDDLDETERGAGGFGSTGV